MSRLVVRQTEGMIGSILALLGLDLAVPGRPTLSRRAGTLEVALPQRGAYPVRRLVDSTGLKLCGSGEWLPEKHGTRTRRSWRKLHIGMDADTGRTAAATLPAGDVDDASQVGPLLDQAGPLTSHAADGAYDRDGVYGEVTKHSPGAAVIVPPKSSAVLSDTAGRHQHSTTATCRRSPSTTAYTGRGPWAVTGARWSRPTSAGSSA